MNSVLDEVCFWQRISGACFCGTAMFALPSIPANLALSPEVTFTQVCDCAIVNMVNIAKK